MEFAASTGNALGPALGAVLYTVELQLWLSTSFFLLCVYCMYIYLCACVHCKD